ncbi:MAG: hypothetical protein IKO83_08380 [Oscillospiraceae bacterium]|nr:hypothetical protein [Oscillospiraceae bacterium]
MEHLARLIEKLIVSRINGRRVLRYALFMFLSLLAQTMVLNRIRILGVCPMVLPAVAVAVGMFEGASWGAFFSLIMGIFADMAFIENTVLFAVLFPALAFVSGFVSQFFINRRFFAFMGVALAALLVTGFVQLLHTAVSDVFSLSMISTALLQTLWSLPFAVLAYLPPARWIE